jgi:L-threonylcarbamoyladenylate synthase
MISADVSESSMDARLVDEAVAAIEAGEPVILPTDTVYGLCSTPHGPNAVRRLSSLKQRDDEQPIALVAATVETLFECVPELRDVAGQVRSLLPGPLTLVLPNPARRFAWMTGSNPGTIGVRVPVLDEPARSIVERVGAVAATSANLTRGPDPSRLDEIPEEIRSGCAVLVDGGELPGTPSTVLDLTSSEPVVLREGAFPADEALARLSQLV